MPLNALTISIAREGGQFVVSDNGVRVGAIPVSGSLQGCRLVVRVLGEPGTILGVNSIQLRVARSPSS
jgi:hypothetical protein